MIYLGYYVMCTALSIKLKICIVGDGLAIMNTLSIYCSVTVGKIENVML